MTPVFMIGTQRSGSNLLRLMINQLDEIASPHPPHILERMYPLLGAYKDLNNQDNFKLLIDDVCRLVELNPVEWSNTRLDRNNILHRCRENSLMAVYGAVYDIYAESQNSKTWCCKSLQNIVYARDIEHYFKTPRYIYLYRDGRDVALSFQKAVVGEKHIYNIAKEWTATQEIALNLKNTIDPSRFFSISYENLTTHTEETARHLCEFLGTTYNETMLDFHSTNEAKNAASSSQLWGNVTKPVMKNNSKKFLSEMSEDDLMIFESVAGHVLDALSYERIKVRKGEEMQFSQQDIEFFNQENSRLKMETMEKVDKDDLERRNRQSSILKEIKSRSAA